MQNISENGYVSRIVGGLPINRRPAKTVWDPLLGHDPSVVSHWSLVIESSWLKGSFQP